MKTKTYTITYKTKTGKTGYITRTKTTKSFYVRAYLGNGKMKTLGTVKSEQSAKVLISKYFKTAK